MATAVLAGTAGLANAQPAKPRLSFEESTPPIRSDQVQAGAETTRNSVQIDAPKSRWGVRLDLDQPANREMELKDVQAGATYKVTPSLRLRGALGFSAKPEDAKPPGQDEKPEARFSLGGLLRF